MAAAKHEMARASGGAGVPGKLRRGSRRSTGGVRVLCVSSLSLVPFRVLLLPLSSIAMFAYRARLLLTRTYVACSCVVATFALQGKGSKLGHLEGVAFGIIFCACCCCCAFENSIALPFTLPLMLESYCLTRTNSRSYVYISLPWVMYALAHWVQGCCGWCFHAILWQIATKLLHLAQFVWYLCQ